MSYLLTNDNIIKKIEDVTAKGAVRHEKVGVFCYMYENGEVAIPWHTDDGIRLSDFWCDKIGLGYIF